MMRIGTTLVIGAGAAKEVNMPTGEELRKLVEESLKFEFSRTQELTTGDTLIANALRNHAHREGKPELYRSLVDAAIHTGAAVRHSLSIDNFIDSHKGNAALELIGKIAITRSILASERLSYVKADISQPVGIQSFRTRASWYDRFMELLTQNCQIEGLEARLSSLTLVIFNYDRSFEQFLFESLMNFYKIPDEEAARLVSLVHIHHPYGTLGPLPWQEQPGIQYGSEPDADQLLEMSKRIKTYTEGCDDEKLAVTLTRLAQSRMIVFLGFAFHAINMNLLMPTYNVAGATRFPRVLGTALDRSKGDVTILEAKLAAQFADADVTLSTIRCNDLFRENQETLSLSDR